MALVMASGVALAQTISCSVGQPCFGTEQADTMTGNNNSTDAYSYMNARGGDDTMNDKGGPDTMVGGPGKDEIRGGRGADLLIGGADGNTDASSDYVYGGRGADSILGGYATSGEDHLFGGKGSDEIYADAGSTGEANTTEVIDCGAGKDTVRFDKGLDVVKNCETKIPS